MIKIILKAREGRGLIESWCSFQDVYNIIHLQDEVMFPASWIVDLPLVRPRRYSGSTSACVKGERPEISFPKSGAVIVDARR